MEKQSIIIIICFVSVCVCLMIITAILHSIHKKRVTGFEQDNSNKVILHLYTKNGRGKINGKKFKDYNVFKGRQLEPIIALDLGEYLIHANYEVVSMGLAGERKIETPCPIDVEVQFEKPGHYHIGLLLESPEEMKKEGYEIIQCLPLSVSGIMKRHKEAYVMCYMEKS